MTKIRLYSDEIIFRMQRAGGVSTVFGEMLARAAEDPDINLSIVGSGAPIDNVVYKEKMLSAVMRVPEKHSSILAQRMTDACIPDVDGDGPIVFNGTYFRNAKGRNVINVLHVHDFTHQFYFPKKQAFINSVLKRKCIRGADAIVCISENTKRDLLEFCPEAANKRVEVIYNGVSSEFRPVGSEKLPAAAMDFFERGYILFVGSRATYKRFDIALDLLGRFKSICMIVVGGGAFTDAEKTLIGDKADRVMLLSGVSTDELNALYSNAVALIYPSQYEGFGIPPLEAMCAGCPAVTFNNSSLPEVMGDAGIMVEEGDHDGLCIALDSLLTDKAWRRTVVEAQIERAKYFDWSKTYAELKGLYYELIEERMLGRDL